MSKRTRTRTTTGASSKGSKKSRILPPSPHGPFWNGTTIDPEIIAVLVNNRDEAFFIIVVVVAAVVGTVVVPTEV